MQDELSNIRDRSNYGGENPNAVRPTTNDGDSLIIVKDSKDFYRSEQLAGISTCTSYWATKTCQPHHSIDVVAVQKVISNNEQFYMQTAQLQRAQQELQMQDKKRAAAWPFSRTSSLSSSSSHSPRSSLTDDSSSIIKNISENSKQRQRQQQKKVSITLQLQPLESAAAFYNDHHHHHQHNNTAKVVREEEKLQLQQQRYEIKSINLVEAKAVAVQLTAALPHETHDEENINRVEQFVEDEKVPSAKMVTTPASSSAVSSATPGGSSSSTAHTPASSCAAANSEEDSEEDSDELVDSSNNVSEVPVVTQHADGDDDDQGVALSDDGGVGAVDKKQLSKSTKPKPKKPVLVPVGNILPKKLAKHGSSSKAHIELHNQLLFNEKMGIDVLQSNRSEFKRILHKIRDTQHKREERSKQTDLEREFEKRRTTKSKTAAEEQPVGTGHNHNHLAKQPQFVREFYQRKNSNGGIAAPLGAPAPVAVQQK